MELDEAFRRIVGQHSRLIVCFAVIGLAIAAFVHLGAGTAYTATARLVLDTPDPKSRTEAAVIADTGQAIATSPAQVRAALGRIGVHRDPLKVANGEVTVRPLGTSGVLQLSVRDRNAQVAAAIANSLAAQVIRARLDVSTGKLQQALAAIEQQINDLGSKISSLDAQIAALTAHIAGGSAAISSARSRRDAYAGQRGQLSQQRVALEAERASLLSNAVLRAEPSIISAATAPTHADASHWLTDFMLGTILGLIVGVGIAGMMEMIRPTLVGGDVLARQFDAPLLGNLRGNPGDASMVDSMWLSERIRLAVEAAGVRNVRLLGAGPPADLKSLAQSLRDRAPSVDVNGSADLGPRVQMNLAAEPEHESTPAAPARRKARRRAVGIDVFDVSTWSPNGDGNGLLLVSPIALKRDQLVDINRLLGISRAQIIGVITYQPVRTPGQQQLDAIVAQARTWSRKRVQLRSPG
jgi:capsular polysaccharide biosynthesis protein